MKYLILPIFLFVVVQLSAQKVEKRNLTKRQYFFYDVNKTQIESDGFYYVDDLGETTLRHGKWKFYDREGELQEVRNYYKNQLHGEVVLYFPNGKKNSIGYFKADVQDSVYREWDETGVLRQEGQYLDGKPVGTWNFYYRDGKQKMVEEVVDGTSYVWQFWLPDSLHTQTVTDGTGEIATYYTNGNLKEWYTYKDGLKDGPFEEASVYGYFLLKGSFKKNLPEGEWKYFYYTGDLEKTSVYKDGKLHGPYFYYYDNEQVNVEGQYENGLKTGTWTWYTKFGKIDMQGPFVNDLQHGDWIYNFPNGDLSYKAQYKNGLRQGTWEYFYENGAKFKVGTFENDKKNGNWKTWYENGTLLMDGDYKDNLEQGVWKNYWENGQLKNQTTFDDGQLHGDWFSYYSNGKQKTTGKYDKALKTGEWREYFDNGRLKDIENYKIVTQKSKINYGPMKDRDKRVSVRHGEFISYSAKDFQKTLEGNYKNDEKEGPWTAYHPGGKAPAMITNYKNGKLDGPTTSYTFRGNKIISEINYKDGLQHGAVKVYDKKGKLVKEEQYKNGIRVIEGTGSGTGFSPR